MTKKHLYKDLYICKWIKVYRPIQANGDCCCCGICFALFLLCKIYPCKAYAYNSW